MGSLPSLPIKKMSEKENSFIHWAFKIYENFDAFKKDTSCSHLTVGT